MASTLRLTVVSYAGEPSPGLSRRFATGRSTIGRGGDNDWILPDPEKHLSSRHCVIEGRANEYVITDISKNGVFLNDTEYPLGNGNSCNIADGDLIAIGDYQLRAEIEGAMEDRLPAAANFDAELPRSGAFTGPIGRPESPFGLRDDPFSPANPGNAQPGSASGFIDPGRVALSSAGFPGPAFDPQGSAHAGHADPDHVPAMGTYFHAPEVQTPIIPPDWNPLALDVEDTPASAPPSAAPLSPPPAPREPESPVVAAPVAEAPKPSVDGDAVAILRAFLEGAGLPGSDVRTADVAAQMRGYGEIMRELVAGIRELLAVRTLTKSEFRIEQTMIRPAGNNPLKFSVDLEQTLSALLLPQRSGYSEPLPAAREAIADLKSHELSVIAGMQKSIAKLLTGLAPDEIERHVASTGLLASLLPGAHKARYWEAYEAIYNRLAEECREDMRSSVRQAFAEAYFDQAQKL